MIITFANFSSISSMIPNQSSFIIATFSFLSYVNSSIWILAIVCTRRTRAASIQRYFEEKAEEKVSLEEFKNALLIYDKFCETITSINTCFRFLFISIIQQLGLHLIILFFNVFNIFVNNPSETDFILLVKSFIYIIEEMIFAVFILICSDFIKSKTKNKSSILHKRKTFDENFRKITEIAQLQS